jgi:hypothetical protein
MRQVAFSITVSGLMFGAAWGTAQAVSTRRFGQGSLAMPVLLTSLQLIIITIIGIVITGTMVAAPSLASGTITAQTGRDEVLVSSRPDEGADSRRLLRAINPPMIAVKVLHGST